MHTGPNIVNDGLVFGYDTGEFVSTNPNFSKFTPYKSRNRFYKGKASVNYIAFQNPRIDSSYSSYTRGTGTWDARHPNAITVFNKRGSNLSSYVNTGVGDWSNTDHAHWQYDTILKKPVVVMHDRTGSWKAKSFGTGMPSWNSLGLTHGSKYTISWLQWVDHLSKNAKAGLYSRTTGGSNGFHDGQANSSTSYNTKLRTWQRVYQTYTTASSRDLASTYLSIYMYGHYNVRGTVKISDVQLELGDHPTAYQEFDGVNSNTQSRNSTEGLLDLAKTTTIDTSNVSFDSNGLIEFDGTDDSLTITGSTNISSDTKTVEIVFKMNGSYSNYSPLAVYANGSSSTNRIWLGLQNSKFRMHGWGTVDPEGTTVISADTWNVCTFSYNRSTQAMKVYTNGVLESSVTNTQGGVTASSSLNWYIGTVPGGWQSVTYSNVKVPVFKLYNRILTDQEVKRNFQAYKKRFGL